MKGVEKRMTRRRIAWSVLIILALLFAGVGIYSAFGGEFVYRVSEAELQERIDAKLPFTKKKIIVTQAQVTLREDNLIGVRLFMKGADQGKYELEVSAVGEPVYKMGEGVFYFYPREIVIEDLTRSEKSISDVVTNFADKYVTNEGLNALLKDGAGQIEAGVKSLAESVAVKVLEGFHVYKLKDDMKGMLAQAALESVEVQSNELVITFTLWNLTLTVLFWIGAIIIIIFLMFALMSNPGWGLIALSVGSFGDS